MTDIVKWMSDTLIGRIGMSTSLAEFISNALAIMLIIGSGILTNWLCQSIFRWFSGHKFKFIKPKWLPYLVKRKLGHHTLLLIPGFMMYVLPYVFFERGGHISRLLIRADIIYLIIVIVMIGNAILLTFLDLYSTTEKNRSHPLQGIVQGLQVMLYFIGGIIIVAVLIDKSPAVLLTGLGASAAVLMLIFKDSILGFVAGVQLSNNKMLKLGDWIQMPDGSANGVVETITLNTVKIRNWDNTISMIPPYTLVTTAFKNWRGMQESGGRRADKCIYIDLNSLEVYSADMIKDIRRNIALMGGLQIPTGKDVDINNIMLYRTYIEIYLKSHPDVNANLDIIVTQKESTPYGLPIQVYFFTKDKEWASHEKKQSDIFSHIMIMAQEFGLKLYQRP